MKVKELIRSLKKCNPESEVGIDKPFTEFQTIDYDSIENIYEEDGVVILNFNKKEYIGPR